MIVGKNAHAARLELPLLRTQVQVGQSGDRLTGGEETNAALIISLWEVGSGMEQSTTRCNQSNKAIRASKSHYALFFASQPRETC